MHRLFILINGNEVNVAGGNCVMEMILASSFQERWCCIGAIIRKTELQFPLLLKEFQLCCHLDIGQACHAQDHEDDEGHSTK
jgi:hypothetical protein